MLNYLVSQSRFFRFDRSLRTKLYVLLALGGTVCSQLLFGTTAMAQTGDSLHLNGGMVEFIQAAPAGKLEVTPLAICCLLGLVGTAAFLLQPLYLTSSSNSNSQAKSPSRSLSNSTDTNLSIPQASSQASPPLCQPTIVLPLFDRLVITSKSIVASICRSIESSPEIQCVPRTPQYLTHLLEGSAADVIVLTGPHITLKSADVILGIKRLQDEPDLDVVMSQTHASIDRVYAKDSSLPALYHFLQTRFERHCENSEDLETAVAVDPPDDQDCYIVRREALLSMMHLRQWSTEVI
jgi:hypothetical protein